MAEKVNHTAESAPTERNITATLQELISKDQQPSIEKRFRELVRRWKEATEFTSSTADMVMHPAYQQIIGMGYEALPMLFHEMRREPDHWFWALKAITGEDPVMPSDRGNIDRMTKVWLQWAEKRGY